jgi:hypothetical protein
MARYRYETSLERARREVKRDLIVSISVGSFLCLTILGIPFGIIVLAAGLRDYTKSTTALDQAQRAAQERTQEDRLRAARNF